MSTRLLMGKLEREYTLQRFALSRQQRQESEARAAEAAQEILDSQHSLASGDDLTLGLRLFDVAIEQIQGLLAPRKMPELPLTGRFVVATELARIAKEELCPPPD